MSSFSLRYAVRSLRRDPSLVIGVVLTFALAIGANAAMFGLVTRLMLAAPAGVTDPARASRVQLQLQSEDGERYTASTTSYPVFQSLARARDAFTSVAAVYPTRLIAGRGADAFELRAIAASGQYFTVLGARPSVGRFFTEADDELPAGNDVAVLSYAFWKSRFAGERDVVGRAVVLDGRTFSVVAVAAPSFSGDGIDAVDVFLPLTAAMRTHDPDWSTSPQLNLVSIVARLRKDVAPAVAMAAATAAGRGSPDARVRGIVLESLLPSEIRNSASARIARWLLGVSVVVLLIATANVGTLLLLRALRKRRDVAVRMALGAGRGHLAAQLTTESVLLAVVGGSVGLILSRWLADIARVTLLPDLAPSDRLVEPRVLVASALLTLAAGLLSGLAPLFLIAHRRLSAELHGAGTLGSVTRSRMQRVLVGTQVALCTVLLVGAGLFVRSLQRVQSQELGFSTAS